MADAPLVDATTPATFDAHASSYDDVALSVVGRVFRDRVRDELRPFVAPGKRVFDLGCGTGLDALWFAAHGCDVTAIDVSPAMVAACAARVERAAKSQLVRTVEGDLDHLDLLDAAGEQADVIVSNFGVINCLTELPTFAAAISRALAPDGTVVLVSMAPWCPPELFQGLLGRNRELLQRRRTLDLREGDDHGVPGYDGLPVRYLSARDIERAVSRSLKVRSSYAIGTALPTFEQRALVEERPRLLSALRRLDRWAERPAARFGIGDHHVIVLEQAS